ncbi:MAG: AAA family ATPase, partial [Chloroflexales bacterium]
GMNLLVGVNGAGKSSVLEVLRLLLSHMLPNMSATKEAAFRAAQDDISIGHADLYASLRLRIEDVTLGGSMRLWRKLDEVSTATSSKDAYEFLGVVAEHHQAVFITKAVPKDTPHDVVQMMKAALREDQARRKTLPKKLQLADNQAPAIYFSAHRSLINLDAETKREQSIGGQATAFVGALEAERQLKVAQFARWWVALESLTHELDDSVATRAAAQMRALEQAVIHFLDNFTSVRAIDKPKPTLLLSKAGTTLDVRLLSDGERSVLALVLDIARRLAQANPQLADPLHDGHAVVLIDEIDLHLHPQWQRSIVQKLTETFPQCQFIATTHSPQIIGEVAPEQIIILEVGKQPYRPDQSLGMDTNWILQFLMGTPNRNVTTNQQLERISDLIEDAEYEQAATEIAKLRQRMPDDPELVKLQVRLARMQILGT